VALYDSGPEVLKTLSATAYIFFGDLSRILSEYFCLQACKITDPAETGGRTNLSMAHIDSILHAANLMTQDVERLSGELLRYRQLIAGARNRLISHLDRATALKGEPIGAHAKEALEAFVENLQLYCDAVGRAVGVGPLDFRVSPGPGDTLDLIRILEEQASATHYSVSARSCREPFVEQQEHPAEPLRLF
jgi:hypothetical protein